MSCCGKGRRAAVASMRSTPAGMPAPRIDMEYVGTTSLTVVGPSTGTRYHFAARGARVSVDGRDLRHLGMIPNLRRV